jgi:hypothetical protein
MVQDLLETNQAKTVYMPLDLFKIFILVTPLFLLLVVLVLPYKFLYKRTTNKIFFLFLGK